MQSLSMLAVFFKTTCVCVAHAYDGPHSSPNLFAHVFQGLGHAPFAGNLRHPREVVHPLPRLNEPQTLVNVRHVHLCVWTAQAL